MIYYTVYKTTNLLNGKIYVGTHKTSNPNDDYLGSGKYLNFAIEKYGKENFKKEILASFDNPEQMFEMEAQIVNEEFVKSKDTYNLNTGGYGGFDYINANNLNPRDNSKGKVWAHFEGSSASILVFPVDERLKTGELILGISPEQRSYSNYRTKDGSLIRAKKDDPRVISGEIIPLTKGLCTCAYDKDGKKVKNVPKDDPRFETGELVKIGTFTGRKHKPEYFERVKETHRHNKHQQKEKNSHWGCLWLKNDILKQTTRAKRGSDLHKKLIKEGWVEGRCMAYKSIKIKDL